MENSIDIYEKSGGDAAWRAWLDYCSVGRVREQDQKLAEGLERHIASAMYAQLERSGYMGGDFENDNPVCHFDTFFMIGSTMKDVERRKPLKQLLKGRMAEGVPLREIVCGMLFSPRKGRIRDIVRDWIAVVKGWKWRTITQPDGTRKVLHEGAGETGTENESLAVNYAFGSRLDAQYLAKEISDVFSSMKISLGLEKRQVALLLYMTARKITLDNPVALGVLGVKKARAYTMKDECMKKMEAELLKRDVQTDDVSFASKLLAECTILLGKDIVESLAQ